MEWRFRMILFAVLASLLFSQCMPARYVKPLDDQQFVVSVSLGGPLVENFGPPVPLPLTSLTAGYGFNPRTTAFASLFPTAMTFGVAQAEVGILRSFWEPEGFWPGFTGSIVTHFAMDIHEANFRFWPQADINFYWHYLQKENFFYTGLSNWFEVKSVRPHGEKQSNFWVPAIQGGHTFVRFRMNYTLEFKYIAPGFSNENIVVDYFAPGNSGAIGFYFSATRKF